MTLAAALFMPLPLQAFELPPEITPAIRQACESDVRRLCIRPTSTAESVKFCVMSKLQQLNQTCRQRLADAGLIVADMEKRSE